jgi:hypothetical protein
MPWNCQRDQLIDLINGTPPSHSMLENVEFSDELLYDMVGAENLYNILYGCPSSIAAHSIHSHNLGFI